VSRDGDDSQTPRVIGALGGFAIVAGSMLGIGIFLSPPIVASHVGQPALFLGVWALGGLTALAGAVACAELGTLMPRAGGDYVFQYEAFGPSVAFASGWVLFGAIFCGSIATLSVGLCTYQLPALLGVDLSGSVLQLPWGAPVSAAQLAAVGLVPLLTALNALGARPSARTQTWLTLLPIGVLAACALWAIARGGAAPAASIPPRGAASVLTIGGLVSAYNAVYFAYSGWINVIYVGGEVSAPQRNIPRALIAGTLAVTALYLLLCAGFLRVLGLSALAQAGEAGSATAALLGGERARQAVTLLIASALLASINATVLGGARVAYAMARRGALWSPLGRVDARHRVPQGALWLQALLACALILSGRFEDLYVMVSLAMVLTGTLTVSCLFVLRRTRPEAPRPYRATGYPPLPALYVVSSLLVIGVMLQRALSGTPGAWYPLLGLGVFGVAFLAHRAWAR